MLFHCCILPVFAVLHFASSKRWVKDPMSGMCLGCICQSISGCNRSLGCEGGHCGLFRITKDYWTDAGTPTFSTDNPYTDGAFERCSTDPLCAAKTVKNYMIRFARDCNEDGMVDCEDYADIHRLAGFSCQGHSDAELRQSVEDCLVQLLESTQILDIR